LAVIGRRVIVNDDGFFKASSMLFETTIIHGDEWIVE
jgi:hypothetical protein